MLVLSNGCSKETGISLLIPEVLAGHNTRFLLKVSNTSTERRAVLSTEAFEFPFLPLSA